jgi:hypothetical protein
MTLVTAIDAIEGQTQATKNDLADTIDARITAQGVGVNGVTATAAELNLNDGAVAGTAVASKTLALGADKEASEIHAVRLFMGAGAGTEVTTTAAELNMLDGLPGLVGFATAAGASNAADTTITINDATGAAIAEASLFLVWLSSDASGYVLATAMDTFAVKTGEGTLMASLTANKVLLVLTKSTGICTVTTTDAGKAAFYINAMPLLGHTISTGTITAGTDYGA